LKADYGYYWSYIFTENGILRVEIVSRRRLFSIFLLLVLVWFVIFVVTASYLLAPVIVVLSALSVLVAPLALTFLCYWILKKRVSSLNLDGLASRKSTVNLSWSAIDGLEVKNRLLKIHRGSKTYKVAVREEDKDDVLSFLMSKVGEKTSIE
jgi:hypothetical protein